MHDDRITLKYSLCIQFILLNEKVMTDNLSKKNKNLGLSNELIKVELPPWKI